ncbi:hypothetical protein MSIMFB_02672 [Mycobacterium simulans]|uniref:Uncharacterized protein n=1 Tax=Mycobacterium simulans TaxID=627089 RepID=A0A7Z7IKE4_9MYCO|nr:hypothetical protein MSIMFB_02672 [Mycobacterium simulans]
MSNSVIDDSVAGSCNTLCLPSGWACCKPTPLPEEWRTREVLKYIIGTLCLFAIAFGALPGSPNPRMDLSH